MTAAAMTAAAGPNERFTATNSTPTVAAPVKASGSMMLTELNPKRRTETPMSMIARGGLSTVMKLDASKLPKKKADQDVEAERAAAE